MLKGMLVFTTVRLNLETVAWVLALLIGCRYFLPSSLVSK